MVGEPPILKVHVHTDDPGAAISLGVGDGHDRPTSRSPTCARRCATATLRLRRATARPAGDGGLVAVADGDGDEAAYRAAGAGVELVAGGQSMNPSAGEIAEAIEASDAEGVLVLPNNRNVVLAAEHAAALAGRPAAVVPTRSLATGLALVGRLRPDRAAGARTRPRLAALQRDAALRRADRGRARRPRGRRGGHAPGQHLALVDGRLRSPPRTTPRRRPTAVLAGWPRAAPS